MRDGSTKNLKKHGFYHLTTNKRLSEDWQAILDQRLVDWLESYTKRFSYHDIAFIDVDGNVVYTSRRNSDLGKNLISGPLKESGLGKLFNKMQHGIGIEDYAPYSPSNNKQVAFIGSPVHKEGVIIGMVALQLPTTPST